MSIAYLLAFAAAAGAKGDQPGASSQQTRKILHDYGACVVRRQPRLASQAILGNVANKELMRRYAKLIDGSCLPVERGMVMKVKFTGDQYRYALADALVRAELAAVPVPALDDVPALAHRDAGSPPSQLSASGKPLKPAQYQAALRAYEIAQAYDYLSRYGECVVRVNPAAARALLLTAPGTPDEAAQFAALGVAFGTCVREGRTMTLGKLALRGTVAVNFYRLAHAARAAPARAAR